MPSEVANRESMFSYLGVSQIEKFTTSFIRLTVTL